MRRGLVWAAGILGILMAYLARRRGGVQEVADPAAELRAKLDAARVADQEQAPQVEAAPEQAHVEPADPDARRRDVHAQARAAIDEMRGDATQTEE